MQTDFNLQPYDSEGDTTGFRTLSWYRRHVFPTLQGAIQQLPSRTYLLDVGCGNGRFVPFFARFFEQLHCIDPICSINSKYIYPSLFYKKCTFENYNSSIQFDLVTFMGSFDIISYYHGVEKTLQKAFHLLKEQNSLVFILSEARNKWESSWQFFPQGRKIIYLTSDGTSKLYVLWKE